MKFKSKNKFVFFLTAIKISGSGLPVRAAVGGTKANAGPQRRIDWAAK